jgi:hypothetical protein
MNSVLRTIADVSAPLALAGLLASFLFYIIREIIKAKLIPAVTKKHALTIILAIINKLFILSLVALVMGILTYALERLLIPAARKSDGWAVKVYDFQNHGRGEQGDQTGERFSGLVLDNLLHRDLDAKALYTRPPEALLHFEPTRGEESRYITSEFRGLGPFIAVTGFVERGANGTVLIHVRVSSVNAIQEVRTLLVTEVEVPGDQVAMRTKAAEISELIYSAIQIYTGGTSPRTG